MTYQELKAFCSVDDTRPEICQPFLREGYLYATDGRLAIRFPVTPVVGGVCFFAQKRGTVEPVILERQHSNPPDAGKVFPEREWDTRPFTLPELPPLTRVPCLFCSHMPEDFDGCMECSGERTYVEIARVRIDEDPRVLFNLEYLHLVKSLQAVCRVLLFPDQLRGEPAMLARMQFFFPGGEGVMMGMYPESDSAEPAKLETLTAVAA
jgi:hypothetical protein